MLSQGLAQGNAGDRKTLALSCLPPRCVPSTFQDHRNAWPWSTLFATCVLLRQNIDNTHMPSVCSIACPCSWALARRPGYHWLSHPCCILHSLPTRSWACALWVRPKHCYYDVASTTFSLFLRAHWLSRLPLRSRICHRTARREAVSVPCRMSDPDLLAAYNQSSCLPRCSWRLVRLKTSPSHS